MLFRKVGLGLAPRSAFLKSIKRNVIHTLGHFCPTGLLYLRKAENKPTFIVLFINNFMTKAHAKRRSSGFTLIELLIVIGIIVILAVAAVLTLNPAELLRQSRDSNRINDLGTLKSALALYLADAPTPSLGVTTNCYTTLLSTSGLISGCGITGFPARFAAGTQQATSSVGIDSTGSTAATQKGWIPVNFASISAGSPISTEPIDAVNVTSTNGIDASYFYAFRVNPNSPFTYELNANMESVKYSNPNGSSNVEANDGGNGSSTFEIGTVPGLNL